MRPGYYDHMHRAAELAELTGTFVPVRPLDGWRTDRHPSAHQRLPPRRLQI